MLNTKNILVVIDPNSDEQAALQQAEEIAAASGAKLTALVCIYELGAEIDTVLGGTLLKNLRKPVLARKKEWLDGILAPMRDRGISIESKVEWAKKDYQFIAKLTEEQDFDLIIKSSHHHSKIQRALYTPGDWHLIRKSKVSILFVRQKQTLKGGQLLLALDVIDNKGNLEYLNKTLLDETKHFSEQLDLTVNLVNAYPTTYMFATFSPEEYSHAVIQKRLEVSHREALETIAQRNDIDADRVFLQEGEVSEVINDVANDISAGIIVMGCHGRDGFSGFLLGNSAESVLESVERNILIVKTPGETSQ